MEACSKIQHGIRRKLGLGNKAVISADQGCTNMQRTNMRTQKLTTILAVLTNERTVIWGLQLVNKK